MAELVARPDSKITRKQVKDLNLPKDLTLGGLIRDGEPMMIKGDTHIQAYDHVVVFCLDTAMRKLEDYLINCQWTTLGCLFSLFNVSIVNSILC